MDGWIMDGWMDGWIDRWMDGWINGSIDGWMDGCTSKRYTPSPRLIIDIGQSSSAQFVVHFSRQKDTQQAIGVRAATSSPTGLSACVCVSTNQKLVLETCLVVWTST